jgi:hypothetical protein
MSANVMTAARMAIQRAVLAIGPLRRLWEHRNRLQAEVSQLLAEVENHRRTRAILESELAIARQDAIRHPRSAGQGRPRPASPGEARDSIAASAPASVAEAANATPPMRFLQTQGYRRTPLYALADDVLSLAPLTGTGPYPVCLITQPKAGTYLVARLLERLGLVNTGVHVDRAGFTDYRCKTIAEMRADYLKFDTRIPIEVSAWLTARGQFVVGHLEHGPDSVSATHHLRRILLVRDARDALVSFMRFQSIPGRGETTQKTWLTLPEGPERLMAFLDQWGGALIHQTHGVLGWMNDPDILLVRFEVLMGDAGPSAQRQALESIARHVGVGSSRDVVSLFLRDVVGKPTKTYSGGRSFSGRYWNEQVERHFIRLGGGELHHALGYPEVWHDTAWAAD